MKESQSEVPWLVRLKRGALERLGLYLARPAMVRVGLFHSEGLVDSILDAAIRSLRVHGIELVQLYEVKEASVEEAVRLFGELPSACHAIVGLGGAKTLDVAKYTAAIAKLPFFAVPTSLSSDGFCSPQASLTLKGRRRSLATGLPYGVLVDLAVCERAPAPLWHSGIGELAAKFTAVSDWKLAYHVRGTPVNDLTAQMSDASVYLFMVNPAPDEQGLRLLAANLMLSGVAMQIAGSSRPAKGSEHLISDVLDMMGARPRLHGLQTGTAAYLVSKLQRGSHHKQIGALFERTGFWESVREQPFSKEEWRIAVEQAPSIDDDFYTILSDREPWPEIAGMIERDEALAGCFE